jgi:GTPase SAR1 family protein
MLQNQRCERTCFYCTERVSYQVKEETDGKPSRKNHKLPKSETISQTTPPNVFRYRDRLMVVYDVSRQASFENVQRWINKIRQNSDCFNIVLVGNKSDSKVKVVDDEEHI